MYELTFLANPNLSRENLHYLVKQLKDEIIRREGEIVKDFTGKKITLAYPIRKLKQGYLFSVDFELECDKIDIVKNLVKSNKSILRHLIITKRIPKPKPIIIKPPRPIKKPKLVKPKEKIKIEELDKKLEEILEE